MQLERIAEIRPMLSEQARLAGEATRHAREEFERAERHLRSLEILIRKMYRRMR
jgi:hypothetical protein